MHHDLKDVCYHVKNLCEYFQLLHKTINESKCYIVLNVHV